MADVLVSLSRSLAGCEFLIGALSRESYRELQEVLQGGFEMSKRSPSGKVPRHAEATIARFSDDIGMTLQAGPLRGRSTISQCPNDTLRGCDDSDRGWRRPDGRSHSSNPSNLKRHSPFPSSPTGDYEDE